VHNKKFIAVFITAILVVLVISPLSALAEGEVKPIDLGGSVDAAQEGGSPEPIDINGNGDENKEETPRPIDIGTIESEAPSSAQADSDNDAIESQETPDASNEGLEEAGEALATKPTWIWIVLAVLVAGAIVMTAVAVRMSRKKRSR